MRCCRSRFRCSGEPGRPVRACAFSGLARARSSNPFSSWDFWTRRRTTPWRNARVGARWPQRSMRFGGGSATMRSSADRILIARLSLIVGPCRFFCVFPRLLFERARTGPRGSHRSDADAATEAHGLPSRAHEVGPYVLRDDGEPALRIVMHDAVDKVGTVLDDGLSRPLECVFKDDDVEKARGVFECEETGPPTRARARGLCALPDACDAYARAVFDPRQVTRPRHPTALQVLAGKCERMAGEREPDELELRGEAARRRPARDVRRVLSRTRRR